jgi:hypothetical protein
MAELIAVVSIIAGAAVAIIVPFIGARLERSRFVEQSRQARMNELRDILDVTLQHLYVAGTILYEIQDESNRVFCRGRTGPNPGSTSSARESRSKPMSFNRAVFAFNCACCPMQRSQNPSLTPHR